MVRRSQAFSPCNITGFFQIHRDPSDPLKTGSTGISVAINRGVTTRVAVKRTRVPRIRLAFNDRPLEQTSVSGYVARKYAMLSDKNWEIRVAHSCSIPTGCGFGTSGAGALGLSLALNDSIGLSLSNTEAAQIAHVSEIACNTGLGTVASVFAGGMTLRARAGAPGEGKVRLIQLDSSTRVITCSYGALPTQRVLGSEQLRQQVNECGNALITEFNQRDPAGSFIGLSRRFAECLGLMSARLSNAVKKLDSGGISSSMMMLGESLFFFVPSMESFPKHLLRGTVPPAIISSVTKSGAHLI